jgi:triosephosphate isomerase (TIM)
VTGHRTSWVLGNWKQNLLPEAAAAAASGIAAGLDEALAARQPGGGDVLAGIAPPFLSIAAARPSTRPRAALWLFAQDCAAQDAGAFTGEVGPAMLKQAGVEGAIVGHSERRQYYGEDDALVRSKLRAGLEAGLVVVLCVGERIDARQSGEHETVVISQLSGAFADLPLERVGASLVLAYEPVWAIGTGLTATPEQAAAMHRAIRGWMRERFGTAGADRSILYGGSVKPDNAADLVAAGDVDGFLVGGASLDPRSFLAIARATAQTPRPQS